MRCTARQLYGNCEALRRNYHGSSSRRRISDGHPRRRQHVYPGTGHDLQLGSFLSQEFDLSQQTLANYGIKTVTVSLSDDRGGRPLALTLSGQSSTVHLSATQIYGHYNQPVSIQAPRWRIIVCREEAENAPFRHAIMPSGPSVRFAKKSVADQEA
jgi:hypothetical protein